MEEPASPSEQEERRMDYYSSYNESSTSTSSESDFYHSWSSLWNNLSDAYTDSDGNGSHSADYFDAMNLQKAKDVDVKTVVTSVIFNTILFMMLMAIYELLRHQMPAVYSHRKKRYMSGSGRQRRRQRQRQFQEQQQHQQPADHPHLQHLQQPSSTASSSDSESISPDHLLIMEDSDDSADAIHRMASNLSESSLPESDRPLDWLGPVLGVSWKKVRRTAGLDGYFFLRFIRMNVRICAVTMVWFFLILVPLYGTGNEENVTGWYKYSAKNVPKHGGWKMWIACVFMYLFSGFIVFVIKQEYRHFLEVRQDFLARGSAHVNPQHHYSIQIENIPYELRSERALQEYFENLFPGKVHSASVVLKVPDVEAASAKCERSCQRLEKAIATYQATGERPVHIVGRGRISVLGVEIVSLECATPSCCRCDDEEMSDYYKGMDEEDDDDVPDRPPRGTRVDTISYYTQELAAHSRTLARLQRRKNSLAETGNHSLQAGGWLDKIVKEATIIGNAIMRDSLQDNHLEASSATLTYRHRKNSYPQAENMTSQYGSIVPPEGAYFKNGICQDKRKAAGDGITTHSDEYEVGDDYVAPFSRSQYTSRARRLASRLGLDYVVGFVRLLNKQIDVALQGVTKNAMSSSGFVTFLDLTSTCCAASAPLTVKASVLHVSMAPEPRDIIWENANVPRTVQHRRELFVNGVLFLGVILWSFPLAAIQAFSKPETLARIPAFRWILNIYGGKLTNLVNGYLPVVALLVLIIILPVIFQIVALKYERRKTRSEVQASMLGRYFYYQLATIYITVTAGVLWKTIADILDHPSSVFTLFGKYLPDMVGYFVALLVTKTLAGLPMIFLRVGALSRMLFLKLASNSSKLTQRELDAIYRQENVQYGWEFPTQLLVVVIVFTYAVICPIILPFGLLYFTGALMVYKKQLLYVYRPVYESGGAMFPMAVQRGLLGLVCAQVTFVGYALTKECYYQPVFLFPLPLLTIYAMNHLDKTYAKPSQRLSLERARECDRLASLDEQYKSGDRIDLHVDLGVQARRRKFDKNSYRQPVLARRHDEPWTYRRNLPDDEETKAVLAQLRQINRFQETQGDSEDGFRETTVL